MNHTLTHKLPATDIHVLATTDNPTKPLILVVEDTHEIRDGMEKLLTADGYRVSLARDEHDARESARIKRPDLILISLAGSSTEVGMVAARIREGIQTGENVPVVIFGGAGISEGDEVTVGRNIHLTRPDNFNQLRHLLARLLDLELSVNNEMGADAPEKSLANHE